MLSCLADVQFWNRVFCLSEVSLISHSGVRSITEPVKSTSDYSDLASEILLMNKAIRYCGMVDRFGRILTQAHRKDLNPKLTERDWQRRALHLAMRYSSKRSWERKLGNLHYTLSKYDVLVMTIIELAEHHLLILSFDPDTKNIDYVLENAVMPLLEENRLIMAH